MSRYNFRSGQPKSSVSNRMGTRARTSGSKSQPKVSMAGMQIAAAMLAEKTMPTGLITMGSPFVGPE